MCVHTCLCVLQEKLVQAIKRIKHEVDECRDAERETYAEAVEVEVLNIDIPVLIRCFFCIYQEKLASVSYKKCLKCRK